MRCSVSYKSKVAMVLGCIGLVSCSAIPDVTHQGQPTGTTAQSRHSGATPSLVCVVQPGDPSNGQEKTAGSGAEIGRRIQQSVQLAGSKTLMIQGGTGQPSAECLRRGGTHVLETRIAHYEDNMTGWSGKPDRIELQLRLSLASEPASVRQISYEAKSNVVASAFMEWGNAKPVSLLKGDFDHLVSRLLRDIR